MKSLRCILVLGLLVSVLFSVPSVVYGGSKVYVTVAFTGGIVVGGAYLIWRVVISRGSEDDRVAYAGCSKDDCSEGNDTWVEPDEEFQALPEMYIPLLDVRF